MLLNFVPGAVYANSQATAGGQGFDPIKGIQSLWAWFTALFHALLDGRGGTAGEAQVGPKTTPPPKSADSLPDPRAMEREIFALINKERTGVKPVPYAALAWDDKLAAVARARAEEALTTGVFTHALPSGLPNVALAKIGYLNPSSENALITTEGSDEAAIVSGCVKGWMGSPGHRENMLSPRMQLAGVGVAVSKAPVNMRDEEHGGVEQKGVHVAVYAIFYDTSGK